VPRVVEALAGKKVVGASAGETHTVAWTEGGEVYTFGCGEGGRLGHGGDGVELVPRVVEALAGKKVVGVSAGTAHTVAWTEGGEVYTFGWGGEGRLGHGGEEHEFVPRVVEALAGEKVVGASVGDHHTVAWTEGGEVYTFGFGLYGRLGHWGAENERVPRVVDALAGKKVMGASAGDHHTVAWTEGEVYTFGWGKDGRLGHGGDEDEQAPRLLKGLLLK
jgi:alpha-tubulin suppressor-like RCC1 family protein